MPCKDINNLTDNNMAQKGNSSLKIEYLHIHIDERLKTNLLTVYEASKILRWMLGQTPQHPNRTKLSTQNN